MESNYSNSSELFVSRNVSKVDTIFNHWTSKPFNKTIKVGVIKYYKNENTYTVVIDHTK